MTMFTGSRKLLLLALLAGASLAACGGSASSHASSGAPPTVICGKTLNATASGAVVYDATEKLPVIDAPSSRGLIFIRVADGCSTGALVSWMPERDATLVDQATAEDGTTVAVVLQPTSLREHFTVTATRNGKRVASATVRLGG
jgi:hypothetical protein